jgi:hypothetical protein
MLDGERSIEQRERSVARIEADEARKKVDFETASPEMKAIIAHTGREHSMPADMSRMLKPGKIDDKGMFTRLYAAGLTHDEIASFFGVSRESVTKMASRMDLVRETANPLLFQERMQEEMLIRMEAILKYMTPDKMNKASLSQLVLAFGILMDKVRLTRGESTQNIAAINVHKLDGKDIEKIRDIIQKHTQAKLAKVREGYEKVEGGGATYSD